MRKPSHRGQRRGQVGGPGTPPSPSAARARCSTVVLRSPATTVGPGAAARHAATRSSSSPHALDEAGHRGDGVRGEHPGVAQLPAGDLQPAVQPAGDQARDADVAERGRREHRGPRAVGVLRDVAVRPGRRRAVRDVAEVGLEAVLEPGPEPLAGLGQDDEVRALGLDDRGERLGVRPALPDVGDEDGERDRTRRRRRRSPARGQHDPGDARHAESRRPRPGRGRRQRPREHADTAREHRARGEQDRPGRPALEPEHLGHQEGRRRRGSRHESRGPARHTILPASAAVADHRGGSGIGSP